MSCCHIIVTSSTFGLSLTTKFDLMVCLCLSVCLNFDQMVCLSLSVTFICLSAVSYVTLSYCCVSSEIIVPWWCVCVSVVEVCCKCWMRLTNVLQLRLMTHLLTLAPRVQSSHQLTSQHQQLMTVSVAHYASCQRQLSSSQQVISLDMPRHY